MKTLARELLSTATDWTRGMHVMVLKELVQLLRDVPLMLFMVYTFTVNVYLNGSAGGIDLQRASLVVHDDDHSATSRELIYRLRSPYFVLTSEVDRPDEGLAMLDAGTAAVFVDIPPQFEQSLERRDAASVQLQIDSTMTVQAYLAASYAEQIAAEYAVELASQRPEMPESVPQIHHDRRLWFNPNENHLWFTPLAELLNVITVFCVLLPAAAMAREKERGTVEQLMVSPLSPTQIMAPKVIGMTIVILIGTCLSIGLIIRPVFHIPLRGSLTLFLAVSALYVTTMTGLGIVAGTIARNMGQVGMLAMLILLPVIILSGTFTPPEGKPPWLTGVSMLVPLRHYFEITTGIFLKGSGVSLLWREIGWLLALGGGIFLFGRWMFQRQFE